MTQHGDIGPNDLATERGHEPRDEHDIAEVVAAVAAIETAARECQRLAGIFCSIGDAAAQRAREGFGLVTPGNDAMALRASLGFAVKRARGA